MNIAQELSIVRDNIAEYGMTNITQLEYDAIYQQGKSDMLDSIIRAEKNKYYCDEELCGESKDCSDCMVRYLEQLKKEQNNGFNN